MGRLYERTVRKLIKDRPAVRHADGDGLYLMTPQLGDPYWMLRYTSPATKKRRELTIGQVSSWSLADARDEAARLRLQIKRDGLDPVQERQQTRRNPIQTLDDLYADYYEKRKLEIASHLKERSLYEREVSRQIGKMALGKIQPIAIRDILRNVARGDDKQPPRPTVSNDLMRMLKHIFNHGMQLNLLQFNPAGPFGPKDAGGEELPANRPMTEAEVQEFFNVLRAIPARFSRENYLACALLIGTCTRKMELLAAPWSEFDLEGRVWNLPSERTKKRRAATIPLSEPVLAWLQELKIRSCGSEWVFPARRLTKTARTPHVCPNTLNAAIHKHFKEGLFSFEPRRVHDLRGTARTMLSDLNVPDDIARRCLNHQVGDRVDNIYNHAKHFQNRKAAHDALCDWLAPIVNGDCK